MKAPAANSGVGPLQRAGYTLLEVILALAIFVGSAAALSRLLLIGLEAAERARYESEALVIAENLLAEIEAGARGVDEAASGSVEEAPDWSYTISTTAAGPTGLYLAVATVEREVPGSTPVSVTLSQLVADDLEIEEAVLSATATE